ncbi:MAG: Apolipoprotein N-acyltransferase (EC [uncultured Sulfurovum sp.]|uniref:Apolipoprotein N-acyltransferase (EC) n=1 Tax=uncultured Sulfurovum sp. TaxID=269237 RepID=A0A6S6T0U5_9BACT|nr:MAG: Apolipoprotein N-acyltransferase (EC [uncultured Sulfurovum sp.]
MSLSIKISDYFTIKNITRGLFIALLSAGSLYLDWFGFVNYFVNTILGLLSFYFLLQSDKKVWFWFGFFMATLWFWWLTVSFKNYGFAWAVPIGLLFTSTTFAFLFGILTSSSEYISKKLSTNYDDLILLMLKALILVLLSTIHPFGFDWYKPELVFTNSYIGIEKWQFALVLGSMVLAIYKKQLLFLFLLLTAYPYTSHFQETPKLSDNIALSNFNINVVDKWKPELQQRHIGMIFGTIDRAINEKKSLVILPESIFALYLNKQPILMEALIERSHDISIVLGALYLDEKTPRNSTYIFKNGEYSIANKVVLVPFGEANPLPSFMGKIVNKLFFDGAPDYVAAKKPIDYQVAGKTFRNAICYEACSEELYAGEPKNMIVISNNGWVSPSIEPTQQKILLQYYSKKYGTTIYHSVNMSDSYIIAKGEYISVQ